jgi:hypothetical protein
MLNGMNELIPQGVHSTEPLDDLLSGIRTQGTDATRTQEFVLRWSRDTGHSFREIVRQQWNFSPSGGTREVED